MLTVNVFTLIQLDDGSVGKYSETQRIQMPYHSDANCQRDPKSTINSIYTRIFCHFEHDLRKHINSPFSIHNISILSSLCGFIFNLTHHRHHKMWNKSLNFCRAHNIIISQDKSLENSSTYGPLRRWIRSTSHLPHYSSSSKMRR